MVDLPGIQISSSFSKNAKDPLDKKMRLTTSERLSLSNVQRWLGMPVYDTDLKTWKTLINDPAGDTTTEADWSDWELSENSMYTTTINIGDTHPTVVVTHNLGTRDLHVSCYELPTYDKILLDTELTTNNTVTFSGTGTDRDVYVIIGQAGGQNNDNPFNAFAITYNELKSLKDAYQLEPGKWYKITDYQTIYLAGTDRSYNVVIDTVPTVEPIIVQATSNNTLSLRGYSDARPNDIIYYDFDDDAIMDSGEGEWEDGAFTEGAIVISNVQQHSFVVDKELSIDDRFYLEIEDSNNSYNYSYEEYGIKFTITDNGDGTYTVDLIDTVNDPIDLTDTNHNYIYIDSYYVIQNRPGYIIRRIIPDKNIDVPCDIYEKRVRYKIDTSSIPVYDSNTNYNRRNVVIYNNAIYMRISTDNKNNQTPSSYSYYWITVAKQPNNIPYMEYNQTQIAGISFQKVSNYDLVPVLGEVDINTWTFEFSLENKENIKSLSRDVCFITRKNYTSQYIRDVNIESGCSNVNFYGRINGLNLTSYSRRVSFDYQASFDSHKTYIKFYDVMITGYIRYGNINMVNSSILQNVDKLFAPYLIRSYLGRTSGLTIGSNSQYIYIGYAEYTKIGDLAYDIYLKYSSRNDFGDKPRGMYSETMQFYNNHFGNEARNITIKEYRAGTTSTLYMHDNSFGDQMGSYSVSQRRTIDYTIIGVKADFRFLYYGNLTTTNIQSVSIGANFRSATFGNGLSGGTIGNNVFNINISGYSNGLNIGHNSYNITMNEAQGVNIGNRCGNITLGNSYGVDIKDFVISLNIPNGNTGQYIRYLTVGSYVQNLNIPNDATYIYYDVSKFLNKATQNKFVLEFTNYVSGTYTKMLVDPTT